MAKTMLSFRAGSKTKRIIRVAEKLFGKSRTYIIQKAVIQYWTKQIHKILKKREVEYERDTN